MRRFAFVPLPLALALVLAWLGVVPAAAAQDLVAVAPDRAAVVHEDPRVRVVRLSIPEQAALPLHDRPRRVVVSLTANHVRLARSDGTTSVTRTEAGTVAWSEPAVRSVANLGGRVENIVVELKGADAPAAPVAAPPRPSPPDYLDEPRHRWMFENQYVRVYDVRIPPGATTEIHHHAYDQLAVFVSGGQVATQVDGQPWRPDDAIEPRHVEFSALGRQPMTHRVRNDGAAEFHVILVQVLP